MYIYIYIYMYVYIYIYVYIFCEQKNAVLLAAAVRHIEAGHGDVQSYLRQPCGTGSGAW